MHAEDVCMQNINSFLSAKTNIACLLESMFTELQFFILTQASHVGQHWQLSHCEDDTFVQFPSDRISNLVSFITSH